MRRLDTLVATQRAPRTGASARVAQVVRAIPQPLLNASANIISTDAEALQVVFDPEKVSYRQLIEFFYKMHDPTTLNRQGGDSGTQYRSGIFFHDEEQEKIAKDITNKVQKEWWKNGKISTQILPAGQWWDAEDYHQLYLDKNPGGYECPSQ
jgi:peptide-methionine (S)-S-oxide reductase